MLLHANMSKRNVLGHAQRHVGLVVLVFFPPGLDSCQIASAALWHLLEMEMWANLCDFTPQKSEAKVSWVREVCVSFGVGVDVPLHASPLSTSAPAHTQIPRGNCFYFFYIHKWAVREIIHWIYFLRAVWWVFIHRLCNLLQISDIEENSYVCHCL